MSHSAYYDQLLNCMHCGLCLPVCPTFSITGREKDSPRGRIRLMKSVADGQMDISTGYMEALDFCLDCQACVSACPAGVQYGDLLEHARDEIYLHQQKEGRVHWFKKLTLGWLFTRQSRLRALGMAMALYQKSGLKFLVEKSGVLHLFPEKLREWHRLMPDVDMKRPPVSVASVGKKKKAKMRVGIVSGCVQDIFFSSVNRDTLEVLAGNGYEVYLPPDQNCCGSVAGHNGDTDTARELARQLIDTFHGRVDQIIINAAGCGSFMKKYDQLLAADSTWAEKARWFAQNTRDIMEFLDENGFTPPENALDKKVTYHEPCHLSHAQQIKEAPRRVLKQLPGISYVELPEAGWCCGSAGVYNITHFEDSMILLDRKMKNLKKTEADIVVTGNPGCMIQLAYGNKRSGIQPEVLHPVTLINRLYKKSGEGKNDD